MPDCDYLVSFGSAGDFSRFRAVPPGNYLRGDRVVVRCPSGLQLGLVMCPAVADHDTFLSKQPMGELLRLATPDDEKKAEWMQDGSERLYADARRLALELSLPLEILDAELTLDGKQATISHLRTTECDYRELVSTLSRRHDVLIVMQNLTMPAEIAEGELGCGRPDCGHGNGGCTSCTTGGCSSGGCAAGSKKEEVAAYLANFGTPPPLAPRTPLL